jgi:hypothetical protein
MSIGIFQVTTNSFRINSSISSESTDYTATALSLQALRADVSQIYTPVYEQQATTPAPAQANQSQEQPSEFWSVPARSDGLRRSRFKGSPERISFIANNNRRVEENSPQSDFQKVVWEIDKNADGAYSLYRSADWDAFQTDETKVNKPNRVALLENLRSAKFRFYRKANNQWEDAWDSENAYVLPQDRFPDLISLKIELPDPANSANTQTWEVVMKPNMRLGAERPKSATQTTQPQDVQE